MRLLHTSHLAILLYTFFAGLLQVSTAKESFTVVAYNVENLFDMDDVAEFDDYSRDVDDQMLAYTPAKFLTKLELIGKVLSNINEGEGPEIILFQELEADFTPSRKGSVDYQEFLTEQAHTTIAELLNTSIRLPRRLADASSAEWLLKALDDAGLKGYHVVVSPTKSLDEQTAHTCAVFSKFPIIRVESHPLYRARDILEVTLDVYGEPFTVYSNHWKSGASNPSSESIRVENAKVLKELIDAHAENDPYTDFLIGGDLNSHYNHSLLFPEIETGINDILGSQGNESALLENSGPLLYNLWYELPVEKRFTEVYRNNRGSLMHLVASRGLYDAEGISYLDGSFKVLSLPGINADALGRPLDWNAVGDTGGGASDHLPVMARFAVAPFVATAPFSLGVDGLSVELPLTYATDGPLELSNGEFLNEIRDSDLGPYIGRLYQVDATISDKDPLTLKIGSKRWDAYVPDKAIYQKLLDVQRNAVVQLVVKPGWWKEDRQFVVEGIVE
jgi:endonuclease/exonuclease/phosphatase family metal-dependent hydrolase